MVNEPRKREGPQLLLRFPEGSNLRDRLDDLARENKRSLTAEIIHRLERSLENAQPLPSESNEYEDRLVTLQKQVGDYLPLTNDLYAQVRRLEERVAKLDGLSNEEAIEHTESPSSRLLKQGKRLLEE